ncbi:protein-ER retention protein [Coemansia spiralis]|uniref:Protein-ER retention protein n=2 Tax=Coemansia TaxID=4863 RepID=A0A9W8L0D9_9FUNG|nr:protein-ER retention protein [Coemansia umbellata]KAJ2624008.1 protein-ER retention protein [Coemansia sp. RSA 1358]KAJ2679617.1 protein-ER retention protein [Coemansia spiralis]
MYFPLTFQVLFLALLAALGWTTNLLLLARAGINVRPILQLAELPTAVYSDDSSASDSMHQKVFRLVRAVGCVVAVGWLVCVLLPTPKAQICATILTYLAICCILVMPHKALCRSVRRQFVGSLVRIINPSLADPVFLSDVVMADILTSCARMFADLYLVLCQFSIVFRPWAFNNIDTGDSGISTLATAVRAERERSLCGDAGIIGVLLVAAPYAFRLRQCINEYLNAAPGSSEAKRHLANAVKYASSFPVICLSAAQKKTVVDGIMETKYSDWMLQVVFGMWLAAVTFNSLYSFYWDIAFDWDLVHTTDGWKIADLIAPVQNSNSVVSADDPDAFTKPNRNDDKAYELHVLSPADALAQIENSPSTKTTSGSCFPPFLRPKLCFSSPLLYYIAMAIDFLLRVAWTMKLSSHIQIDMLAYGGFWLNAIEIYRRWQWTFLRIEKEAAASSGY